MLRPCALLDLLPSAPRIRMLQKALFAAAQFIAFPGRKRRLVVLLCDAIPKILDKLQALRSSEFEKRREFLIHKNSNIVSGEKVQARTVSGASQSFTKRKYKMTATSAARIKARITAGLVRGTTANIEGLPL